MPTFYFDISLMSETTINLLHKKGYLKLSAVRNPDGTVNLAYATINRFAADDSDIVVPYINLMLRFMDINELFACSNLTEYLVGVLLDTSKISEITCKTALALLADENLSEENWNQSQGKLLVALNSNSEEVRRDVFALLVGRGKSPAYHEHLISSIEKHVYRKVGFENTPAGGILIPYLQDQLLNSDSVEVKKSAGKLLSILGFGKNFDTVYNFIVANPNTLAYFCFDGLAAAHSTTSLNATLTSGLILTKLLKDNVFTTSAAVPSLPEAMKAYVNLLSSESESIRSVAVHALFLLAWNPANRAAMHFKETECTHLIMLLSPDKGSSIHSLASGLILLNMNEDNRSIYVAQLRNKPELMLQLMTYAMQYGIAEQKLAALKLLSSWLPENSGYSKLFADNKALITQIRADVSTEAATVLNLLDRTLPSARFALLSSSQMCADVAMQTAAP